MIESRPVIALASVWHLRTASRRLVKIVIASVSALATATPARHAAAQPSGSTFDVAVTVDDVPGQGALPRGVSRVAIARLTLKALRRGGVRQAYGFVNASRLGQMSDGSQVLDAWVRAGQPMGNHGYSHVNLSRSPQFALWAEDVVRGEGAVATRTTASKRLFYRFPNLAEGRGATQRAQALSLLRDRGYRVAPVSLSFSDWSYADAYSRCRNVGNPGAVVRMKRDYLRRVDIEIDRIKAVSRAVTGRVPPQILLTHLNAWGAATLPAVLRRLKAKGARFVPLERALADPVYAEAERTPGGGPVLERLARARRIELPAGKRLPSDRAPGDYCR